MNNEILFNDIDGLVLATIACQSNVDIYSWIGFIDFYYRIVLSYEEFNEALIKLQKSGMIIYFYNTLQCTEHSRKLIAGRQRMSVLNWIFKVQERIVKIPYEEAFDVLFSLPKENYINQLNKYHIQAKKHYD